MVKNKFGAKKIEIDGHTFDSLKEGRRYNELKLLIRCGNIESLELQPKYPIIVNGVKIGFYKADFRYFDCAKCMTVVEDVKGLKKGSAYQLFRLKKKLVEAIYKIKIEEV